MREVSMAGKKCAKCGKVHSGPCKGKGKGY